MGKTLRISFLLICILTATATTAAQKSKRTYPSLSELVVKAYTDSLSKLTLAFHSNIPHTPVRQNPYYFPLIGSPTFYFAPVRLFLETDSASISDKDSLRNYLISKALLTAYMRHPELFQETENDIQKQSFNTETRPWKTTEKDSMKNEYNVFPTAPNPIPTDLFTKDEVILQRPKFWHTAGSTSLQFAQNYISKNWSGGGSSNNVLQGGLVFQANYDNLRGLQWDNKAELNLGFITSKDDTVHQYKTSTDLIRLTSNLGLKAIKNWYYSLSTVITTQFLPGYKNNDRTIYSTFASPITGDINLGMNYKLKNEKLDLSLILAPAAYEFKIVSRDAVDGTQFGLKEGHSTLNKIGSSLTLTHTWQIIPLLKWTTRMYYFTTYKNTLWEWENTFDFLLTRYISTRLYTFNRFDDSRTRKEGESFFQFKELLSIGLNYAF